MSRDAKIGLVVAACFTAAVGGAVGYRTALGPLPTTLAAAAVDDELALPPLPGADTPAMSALLSEDEPIAPPPISPPPKAASATASPPTAAPPLSPPSSAAPPLSPPSSAAPPLNPPPLSPPPKALEPTPTPTAPERTTPAPVAMPDAFAAPELTSESREPALTPQSEPAPAPAARRIAPPVPGAASGPVPAPPASAPAHSAPRIGVPLLGAATPASARPQGAASRDEPRPIGRPARTAIAIAVPVPRGVAAQSLPHVGQEDMAAIPEAIARTGVPQLRSLRSEAVPAVRPLPAAVGVAVQEPTYRVVDETPAWDQYDVISVPVPPQGAATPVAARDGDSPPLLTRVAKPYAGAAAAAPAVAAVDLRVRAFDVQQYVVVPGDTFSRIADQMYGRADLSGPLARFNGLSAGGDRPLTAGMRLTLPPQDELFAAVPAGAATPAFVVSQTDVASTDVAMTDVPAADAVVQPLQRSPEVRVLPRPIPQPAEDPTRYRTVGGETLFMVATRTLGQGNRWREIFELNRDVIDDGFAKLPPRVTLRLPPR